MFEKVDAALAFETSFRNKAAKWPSRTDNRFEPICLPAINPSFKLVPGESIFTIGSCFARHIEIALKNNGFAIPALDFNVPQEELYKGDTMVSGILNKYNPQSMLNEIEFTKTDGSGEEYLIKTNGDRCVDAQLHSNTEVSLARGLERRQQVRTLYKSALENCRVIIITLGLSEAYWDDHSKIYLNDNPGRANIQRYPGRFKFEVLSPDVVISVVDNIISSLKRYGREDQKVLLTVSPVPLSRTFTDTDVITANTYSKAVLRVAAEVARRKYDWVDYYPSFESVTNTDMDAAWEDDLRHVRRTLVAANVERMIKEYT